MGYTSQIIFVVEKPLVGSLLTLFSKKPSVRKMLTYDHGIETDDDGHMMFQIDAIKWYLDSPDVQAVEDWMDNQECEDKEDFFSFNRLGDDFGDHESRGNSEAYEVYPSQTLEVWGS
jgi:hypothetical protein